MNLDISKEEAVEVLDAISLRITILQEEVLYDLRQKANSIQKDLTEEMIEAGNCPHLNIRNISDLADLHENKIRVKCMDCNSILTKKL